MPSLGKGSRRYTEGELIDWSVSEACRMVRYGVTVGDREIPRRQVVAKVWHVARAWFKWTTAVPGDMFWEIQRDLIVCVDGGLPRDRTVRVVSGQAMGYGLVRKVDLETLFAITPPEPSKFAWWQLQRVKEARR